jgi:Chalcone isomerase-like
LNRRHAFAQILKCATQVSALGGVLSQTSRSFAQTNSSETAAGVAAPPAEITSSSPSYIWEKRGTGELKVFLFKVYDANLWVPKGLTKEANPLRHPLALEMTYTRKVKSEDIVESSKDEIIRLAKAGTGIESKISDWTAQMRLAFPAVASGDRLVGVHWPGKGASFFHNGRPTAAVNDAEFTQAFFGIWLDERTKRPELRNSLLKMPSGS